MNTTTTKESQKSVMIDKPMQDETPWSAPLNLVKQPRKEIFSGETKRNAKD
jgi:hypothetical protein